MRGHRPQQLKQLGAVALGAPVLLPWLFATPTPMSPMTLERRLEQVLVDKFQHVNLVPYRLLRHLAQSSRNRVVVGDDDQALYGWLGAQMPLLLNVKAD